MATQTTKWALYGCFDLSVYSYGSEDRELIALFSSKELAEEYVEKSKLKRPRPGRIWREASLLSRDSYDWVAIEKWYDEPELDPKI